MKFPTRTVLTVIALAMTSAPGLAQAQQPPGPKPVLDLGLRKEIEPQAIALIKAMCDKLGGCQDDDLHGGGNLREPGATGQPLAYTTLSERHACSVPTSLRVDDAR